MGMLDKLRRRLDKAGVRPSTRRGQNFLMDTNQLRFIVDIAGLAPADVVLEVGPGTGLLTRQLARSGALVLAVELDHGLLPIAREETAKFPNVFFLRADILAGKNRINPEVLGKVEELLALKGGQLLAEDKAAHPVLKCVSNLPYSAGTPLVMNLLCSPLNWNTGVFLLQREVAERITAPPGGKNYGALSIASSLASEAAVERIVGPNCFWPRPKVESAVIKMRFKPLSERMSLPWTRLRSVTNAVFGSRRKILKNALKGLFPDADIAALLAQSGMDPDARGEQLPPERFLDIANMLESA